ncbi:CopG family transcriptional regulator [Rhizobium leguminosarum]|uniref:CopG family transcriptional regulator n=1 Tax=Rhizobium leguminosarum TaxID=384 RepID=UPI001C9381CD|nr:CopG family transcriptional regulator [Rhizobium leguminosarum]MBY5454586.1 CopG family transcriptional regulator [Rhizobium leguminosarum]
MAMAAAAALLDDTAKRIADISPADLQTILRRAALRLRSADAVSFDDNVEEALRDLAGDFDVTRNDMVRYIVREWLEQNAYLPMHALDEDGEVEGTA